VRSYPTLCREQSQMNPSVYVRNADDRSTAETATASASCVAIIEHRADGFYILPAGPSAERIAGIREGSYASVGDCLDAISLKTGAVCRRWGQDTA
jgi:hypothetical protein